MSFISGTSDLTLGNNSNTTINIGTTASNPTINIGVANQNNPVLIRGLDPILSSNTPSFANYRPISSGYTSGLNSYYVLPFSTSQNLLIQWGQVPDTVGVANIPFQISYNVEPFMFVGKINNGGSGAPVINAVTTTTYQIDSSRGDFDKSSFNWLAIGLRNK